MKRFLAVIVLIVLAIVAWDVGRLSGLFDGFGSHFDRTASESNVDVSGVEESEVDSREKAAELDRMLVDLGISGVEGEGVWRNELPEGVGPVVDRDSDGRDWVDEGGSVYFFRSGSVFDGKTAKGGERELLGKAVREVMLDLPNGAVVIDVDWTSTGQMSPLLFVRGELDLTKRVRMSYELLLLE